MRNISDEMLAAYIDGNATVEEREIISNAGIDIPSYILDVKLSSDIDGKTGAA